MNRILGAIFLTICAAAPASATSITWSSATLSDDNGGLFLTGATASGAGNVWTLQLPNYRGTGDVFFSTNQVDVSVSATAVGGFITGVTYTYVGLFAGVGSARFAQSANALGAAGVFSTPTRTGLLPRAPTAVLNLLTVLNLDGIDASDSAAVTQLQFQLTTVDTPVPAVPEPSTIVLVALGAAMLLPHRLARARHKDRHIDVESRTDQSLPHRGEEESAWVVVHGGVGGGATTRRDAGARTGRTWT